jgi:hypothetical protein
MTVTDHRIVKFEEPASEMNSQDASAAESGRPQLSSLR